MATRVTATRPVDGPWTLPDDWHWERLGSFVSKGGTSVTPGRTPEEKFQLYSVPSHPTGQPESIVGSEIGSAKQAVAANDILLCKINPRINRVWKVVDYDTGRLIASTEWIRFAPDERVEPDYLRYFLMRDAVRNYLAANASGVGGSLTRVRPSVVEPIPFPLTSRDQQRRIVARIDELFAEIDDGEAALARVRDDLATWRKALLKSAVTGELTTDWRADHPSTETGCALLARILVERRARWSASPTGRGKSYAEPIPPSALDAPPLPAGWARCSADQVSFFITKGTTPPKNLFRGGVADIPFIRVTNLTSNGSLNFSDKVFVTRDVHEGFLSRSITLPADVLMNIVGPPLGQVSVVPNEFPEWNINQAIARFRPIDGLLPEYLALMMRSQEVQAWFARRAKATSGQVNLTLELCRAVPLALPPVAEQHEILRRLADVLTSASMDMSPMQQVAATLRQSILAAAFRGDLA